MQSMVYWCLQVPWHSKADPWPPTPPLLQLGAVPLFSPCDLNWGLTRSFACQVRAEWGQPGEGRVGAAR